MMVHKALAYCRIAARQRLHDRAAVIGRIGFYALVLFIFSRLWSIVLERSPIEGIDASNFVWYLAITEWIVLSVPLMHNDVERDVIAGDLVYRLTRPVPYPIARFAEGFGDLVVRMAVLGVFGFTLAWLYTGQVPFGLLGGLAVALLGVAAGALTLVFYLIIGLLAFWIHDTRPVYWLWQKASFVLGGLIVPLQLYPDWLRTLAAWSPFSALLHGPGRIALGDSPEFALGVALRLAAWTVATVLAAALVYRRGLRTVTVGGG